MLCEFCDELRNPFNSLEIGGHLTYFSLSLGELKE